MDNKYSIGQAKLGDLVQSDANGDKVICLVVGLPDKVNNFHYVKLPVLNLPNNLFFQKTVSFPTNRIQGFYIYIFSLPLSSLGSGASAIISLARGKSRSFPRLLSLRSIPMSLNV